MATLLILSSMFKMRMIFRGLVWALFPLICLSCAPKLSEEEIKRIEDFDPEFKEFWLMKQEMDLKIAKLRSQIASEEAELQSRIRELRERFYKNKARLESQISQLRNQLEPKRIQIRGKLENSRTALKEKSKELKNLETMLKATETLLNKSKAIDFSSEEQSKWQERIGFLRAEKTKISKEIDALKKKIYLYRVELQALRQ